MGGHSFSSLLDLLDCSTFTEFICTSITLVLFPCLSFHVGRQLQGVLPYKDSICQEGKKRCPTEFLVLTIVAGKNMGFGKGHDKE